MGEDKDARIQAVRNLLEGKAAFALLMGEAKDARIQAVRNMLEAKAAVAKLMGRPKMHAYRLVTYEIQHNSNHSSEQLI